MFLTPSLEGPAIAPAEVMSIIPIARDGAALTGPLPSGTQVRDFVYLGGCSAGTNQFDKYQGILED